MAEAPDHALGSDTLWPRRGRSALHVAGLACVALAQPVFDLIGRHEQFLIVHRLLAPEIVAFAVILALAVPGAIALSVVAADLLSRRLGAALYLAATGGLVAVIVLQALKDNPAPAFVLVVAALTAGALFARGVRRRPAFSSFLSLVAVALVAFPALFLLRPSVFELLFAESGTMSAPLVASDTPIVVVVFDELPLASLLVPGRRIDDQHFPAFAELAASSTWFRNTTTVAYDTNLAIPGILTGRYPDRPLPHAGAYPRNLFTWLGKSYRMNVFETGSRLCLPELCPDPFAAGPVERLRATFSDTVAFYPHVTLPSALRTWAPGIDATWRDFRASPSTRAEGRNEGDARWVFERFVASLERTQEPTLSFLHVNLPHFPWMYLPSGRVYSRSASDIVLRHGLVDGWKWRDDEWFVEQAYQGYLLQLAYTDRLLGQLLDRLRDTGLFDRSLLVVVADHGGSFQAGQGRRSSSDRNLAELLFVPLFVKLPFQEAGRIRDFDAQTIDVLPTIAEVLGSELPWEVDGRSLLSPEGPGPQHELVYWDPVHGLTQKPVQGPLPELLDAAVEHKADLFRDGFYQIGPFRELLGSSPEDHLLAPASQLEVELADPRDFENVDPEGAYLPARVGGEIRSVSAAPPYHLAVAVNGEIQAVTRSYTGPTAEMFWAMLPESAFRKGLNRLALYEVSGGGSEAILAPVVLPSHPP